MKYFGVENEMVSLRSSILEKDNQIAALQATVQKLTGSVAASAFAGAGFTSSEPLQKQRKRMPSPDKDLADAFGDHRRSSFGTKK